MREAGAGGARAQAGDHVRVTGGQHEGQTGMVVRVEGAACVLVSDAAKAELRVFVRDLSEAASAASGPDTCAPAAARPMGCAALPPGLAAWRDACERALL